MLPLPQTAEYALRAVLRMARQHPRPMRVETLAEAVDAPANYLAKTLGQLARAGVLTSSRGPNGGFRLADDPGSVSLERVIDVFRDVGPTRCLLGSGPCGRNPSCPVHSRWRRVAADVNAFFRSTTIAHLVPAPRDGAAATSSRASSRPSKPLRSSRLP